MNNMIKKKGRGGTKRGREYKQIEKLSNRQVTFTKRRGGVFNKASELCILTGAKATVLCESFGGRIYAFAPISVESIVDKYLGEGGSSEVPENNSEVQVNSPCMHEELQKKYLKITKETEVEKNKSKNMMEGKNKSFNNNNNMEQAGNLFWWKQPFEDLEEEELKKYISSMEELKNKLLMRADDLMLIKSSSSLFDATTSLNSNDGGLISDEPLANQNITNTEDGGFPDEFFPDQNLNTEDDGLPNEPFANNNFNDAGPLNEFLAIQDPNLNDGLIGEFFADLELPGDYGNNVQVPNNYGNEMHLSQNNGNFVVSDEYADNPVDLYDCGTDVMLDDFSFVLSP